MWSKFSWSASKGLQSSRNKFLVPPNPFLDHVDPPESNNAEIRPKKAVLQKFHCGLDFSFFFFLEFFFSSSNLNFWFHIFENVFQRFHNIYHSRNNVNIYRFRNNWYDNSYQIAFLYSHFKKRFWIKIMLHVWDIWYFNFSPCFWNFDELFDLKYVCALDNAFYNIILHNLHHYLNCSDRQNIFEIGKHVPWHCGQDNGYDLRLTDFSNTRHLIDVVISPYIPRTHFSCNFVKEA